MNRSEYTIMNIYITLTSINLFPSLNNSISPRLTNIKNNLVLSGSVRYSWNSWILLGVRWSGCCLNPNISIHFFVFISGYDIRGFNSGFPMYSLKNFFESLYWSIYSFRYSLLIRHLLDIVVHQSQHDI